MGQAPGSKVVELVLLIGQYAQRHVLDEQRRRTLTEPVRHWQDYGPRLLPLPHPSWRVLRWSAPNPWFQDEVVPALQVRTQQALALNEGAKTD